MLALGLTNRGASKLSRGKARHSGRSSTSRLRVNATLEGADVRKVMRCGLQYRSTRYRSTMVGKPPICHGSEMLHAEVTIDHPYKTTDVYYCPDCGRTVEEETGEVIDAGR